VVEDTFTFPRVQHYAMEPHAAIAAWDDADGLTVWASTQNPFSVRVELAKMFDAPLGRIRVVVPLVGGGFGSKTYAKLEPITAILARAAGRPVRLAISAEDAFRTVRRCDARSSVRLGFRRDGTLAGGRLSRATSTSAPTRTSARASSRRGRTPRPVPIASPTSAWAAPPSTPTRHLAAPSAASACRSCAWAVESLMDEAARRLDRDPVELRRQNLLAHGEEFAAGDTPIDGKFEESLSRAAEAIGWTQARAADRGRGVAMMIKASIAPSVSEAIVRLHADGSVTVLASTVELGQGARTVMAQIAAEVLAVSLSACHRAAARHQRDPLRPDDELQPLDDDGRQGREAGRRRRGRAARADRAGRSTCRARRLRLDGAAVCHGERRLDYGALCARLRHGGRRADRPRRGGAGPSAAPLGGSTPFWEMAVGAAEITLDVETGAVTVEDYVSVADVGRCINPLSCRPRTRAQWCRGSATRCSRRWSTTVVSSSTARCWTTGAARRRRGRAAALPIRRERRRPRSVRGQGRGRGQPGPCQPGDRQCAGATDRRPVP
jgi:CO/xanthine dehydrogenase Mo-binding subunit